MRSKILMAALVAALPLAACQQQAEQEVAAMPDNARITLPPVPADLRTCFKRSFPEIRGTGPEGEDVLTKADLTRIIGQAKLQDRRKTACGLRGLAWMDQVVRAYGKPAS